MGLESVEIVLDLEKEFGIDIPDEDSEQLHTVGSCVRYVAERKGIVTTITCATAHAFYRFRRKLVESNGIHRRQIRLSTKVIELLPANRQQELQRSLVELGLERIPRPRRFDVRYQTAIAVAVIVVGGLLLCAGVVSNIFTVPILWQIVAAIAVIGGVIVAAPTAYREIRSPIDPHLRVRDVVLALAPQELVAIEARQRELDLISLRVRQIVAGVMGIHAEDVSESSHFVRDLGVD